MRKAITLQEAHVIAFFVIIFGEIKKWKKLHLAKMQLHNYN